MRSFPLAMRGYTCSQVDELFERIDGTLGRGPATTHPVTLAEVRAARFSKSIRGYAPRQVDEAMKAAEQELEQRSDS
jgi:DivIVA domain-containing protein